MDPIEAKRLFNLAEGFTNFNHGSFGAVAKKVKEHQNALHLEAEARPDNWFRETFYEYVKESRRRVANMVKADTEDVVLVENASTALSSVLRSRRLKKGDRVLRFNNTYNSNIENFKWLEVEQVVINIPFPLKDEQLIVDEVKRVLDSTPDIKLCLFCHISSFPTLIMPIEAMIKSARAAHPKSIILVDGAHAPGIIPLSMKDLGDWGADYYTGNLHKWCYAPKGCAFMWTAPNVDANKEYENLAPTVISSTGERSYTGRYAYTGTRDYTAFCTIPAALDFCQSLGGHEAIAKRNHDLIIAGAKLCAERWGTYLLAPEKNYSVMADVVFPSSIEKFEKVHLRLKEEDDIYFIGKEWIVGGETQVISRLSANIYLDIRDFEKLAEKAWQYLQELPQ